MRDCRDILEFDKTGGIVVGCKDKDVENIVIPRSILNIENGAFVDCYYLKNIRVDKQNPNYVDIDGVLYNKDCTQLVCYPIGKKNDNYRIPSSVTEVRCCAFEGCLHLLSIEIPESVTEIGNCAFAGCESLESVNLPNGITEISGSLFADCTSLSIVNIPDSVVTIGDGAFENCSSLYTIKLPNKVSEIGEKAFSGCSSIKTVEFPEKLKRIGDSAFAYCDSLKDIRLNSGLLEVGWSAFECCTSLEIVDIPLSVNKIGSLAFANSGLKEMHMHYEKLQNVYLGDWLDFCYEDDMEDLWEIKECTLFVPSKALNLYRMDKRFMDFKDIKESEQTK